VMFSKDPTRLAGCIDVLDMLTFTCAKFGIASPTSAAAKQAFPAFHQPVEDILNVSGRDRVHTSPTTAPAHDFLKLLSSPNTHRMLLQDESKRITGLQTQSMAIRFLEKNKSRLPRDLLKMEVTELFPPSRVWGISHDKYVIDALLMMDEREISGLAVVNEVGELVANISASDLKRMVTDEPLEMIYDVYSRLDEFLNLNAPRAASSSGLTTPRKATPLQQTSPIYLTLRSTLEEMMDVVEREGIHRVYIVNEKRMPVRVITLGDMLEVFAASASPILAPTHAP